MSPSSCKNTHIVSISSRWQDSCVCVLVGWMASLFSNETHTFEKQLRHPLSTVMWLLHQQLRYSPVSENILDASCLPDVLLRMTLFSVQLWMWLNNTSVAACRAVRTLGTPAGWGWSQAKDKKLWLKIKRHDVWKELFSLVVGQRILSLCCESVFIFRACVLI